MSMETNPTMEETCSHYFKERYYDILKDKYFKGCIYCGHRSYYLDSAVYLGWVQENIKGAGARQLAHWTLNVPLEDWDNAPEAIRQYWRDGALLGATLQAQEAGGMILDIKLYEEDDLERYIRQVVGIARIHLQKVKG